MFVLTVFVLTRFYCIKIDTSIVTLMAHNFSSHPYQQRLPNIQLRSQEPSRFPQDSNYSSEQQGYIAPSQPVVPQQGTLINLPGPQIRPSIKAVVSHSNIPNSIDSQLLVSNIHKGNQIANLKATIKNQQDRINLLESERDLLSNRLHIVQSRLEPHSKWNPKYVPELDKMIIDLKQSINPELKTTRINDIIEHCDQVSVVLNKIFYSPSLHSSAPTSLQPMPQPNCPVGNPTQQRQPIAQQNQVFIYNAPQGLYPVQSLPPSQSQNIVTYFPSQN